MIRINKLIEKARLLFRLSAVRSGKSSVTSKKSFERAKVAPTFVDRIIELVVAALMMITIILSVYFYFHLPEKIPTHFNLDFEPNAFASKNSILFVLILMIVVIFTMWLSTMFPSLVNLPVKKNPEKEIAQQRIACRLCHVLAIWIVLLFLIIILSMSSSLLGVEYSVWKYPTIFCVIGLIGTIVYYSIKIRRI